MTARIDAPRLQVGYEAIDGLGAWLPIPAAIGRSEHACDWLSVGYDATPHADTE